MFSILPKFLGLEVELGCHLIGSDREDSVETATNAVCSAFTELFSAYREDSPVEASVREFGVNGFRFYKDHTRPEIASPLMESAADLVLMFRETLSILNRCLKRATEKVGPIRISWNNSSRLGVSWGHHLSILVTRSAFDRWRDAEWKPLYPVWLPWLVTSLPLLGSGKVGAEKEAPDCAFQISSRADFFDKEISPETVFSKSLWNTRDEALADETRFARCHTIFHEFSFFEYSMFLRLGVTQLLIALLEEEYSLSDFTLDNPLKSLSQVSRDLALTKTISLNDGRNLSALEIQEELAEAVATAVVRGSAASMVPDAVHIIRLWRETIDDLRKGAPVLKRRIPWIFKNEFLSKSEDPIQAKALDLKCGELSSIERLYSQRLVDRLEDFLPPHSLQVPPSPCPRDQARAEILKKFGGATVAANWHYLVLQDSAESRWWIDLGNPLEADEILKATHEACGANEFIHRLRKTDLAFPAAELWLLFPIDQEKEPENHARESVDEYVGEDECESASRSR